MCPWRSAAVLAAVSAIALAACGGGSSSPHVASLPTSTGSLDRASTNGRDTSSPATHPHGNATKLVDEWAACMRSHGDPSQADPIIDTHGVINITIPMLRLPGPSTRPGTPQAAGDAHDVTGACSQYLAAAQVALRAEDPVSDPLGMDNQADLLKYVNCMRASGVPNYPYPDGDTTNFNGTGVDPTSPLVVKISIRCGNKLHLPLWWSAGWGPPGDVSVRTARPPGAPPPGALVPSAAFAGEAGASYGAGTGG